MISFAEDLTGVSNDNCEIGPRTESSFFDNFASFFVDSAFGGLGSIDATVREDATAENLDGWLFSDSSTGNVGNDPLTIIEIVDCSITRVDWADGEGGTEFFADGEGGDLVG